MRNYKICALAILVYFLCFYSLFSIGHFGGDGYGDYLTAESIVLDGNLTLYDRPVNVDALNYQHYFGTVGRNGLIYSSRISLGLPFILAIFYFLGHIISIIFKTIPHDFVTMFFVSFANPVITALTCLLVFLISKQLNFRTRTAVVLSFIYGLSTMAPVYARTGFPDSSLALFCLLSIYLLLRYKAGRRTIFLALAALSIAYLVFIKYYALIFVPCFVFYYFWITLEKKQASKRSLKDILIFSGFLIGPLILLCFINWYMYGSFIKLGGSETGSRVVHFIGANHILKGIYYYFFSTGKGFFLFNLPIILAFFGIRGLVKKEKKEAILLILIFAVNVLFFIKSFRRGSLFSWGPRYLLPSLAVSIFFIGEYYERYKDLFGRICFWFLSITGALVMLPCMFLNQSKFYFFIKERLSLDEYMINFIPDLSPVLGAWKMFISKIALKFFNINMPFVYNPDYKLVKPVIAGMEGYNNFDSWFLKISNFAPGYRGLAILVSLVLLLLIFASLFIIIKNLREEKF